jgi:folylpolyglutamate synthase/dihydropteroate synthase
LQRNLTKHAHLVAVDVYSLLPTFEAEPWLLFFDKLLAVALQWFAEQSVDLLILEAGVGGRYDSTNFVPPPAVCIITSISLDHQSLLGETIKVLQHCISLIALQLHSASLCCEHTIAGSS